MQVPCPRMCACSSKLPCETGPLVVVYLNLEVPVDTVTPWPKTWGKLEFISKFKEGRDSALLGHPRRVSTERCTGLTRGGAVANVNVNTEGPSRQARQAANQTLPGLSSHCCPSASFQPDLELKLELHVQADHHNHPPVLQTPTT